MKRLSRQAQHAITSLVLIVTSLTAKAQQRDNAALEDLVQQLRIRNQALERSLAEANRTEKDASAQLAAVRLRLEALGRNLLDGGEDRLIQATSEIQVRGLQVTRLEKASSNFAAAVSEYLAQSVAADPQARLRVESAMRELDEVLGLRQKPAPAAAGNASQAKVISIDSESGLLVLNIGEAQQTKIGTTYQLVRGDQPLGEVIIADVRRNVSGAFVENLDTGKGPVRPGDTAILITQQSR